MEENLNIFGKNQGEIGSLDKNLVLRTKGRVYIRYGRKYIDLLDSQGNLNVKVPKVLSKITSKDQIKSNGFYLLDGNLYAYVDGETFQITGTEGSFLSYAIEQNLDSDQINTAQKNIGLKYNSIEEASKAVKDGIVFIGSEMYYINNGSYTKIGLQGPLESINNSGLSATPDSDNQCIAYLNGQWVYFPLVTQQDLVNLKQEIISEIDDGGSGESEENSSGFDLIQYSKVYKITEGDLTDTGIEELETFPTFSQTANDIAILSFNALEVLEHREVNSLMTLKAGNKSAVVIHLKVVNNETLSFISESGAALDISSDSGYMFTDSIPTTKDAILNNGIEVDYVIINGNYYILEEGFSINNKNLYIKAESSEKEKFKIDYANDEIAIEENYPNPLQVNQHTVLGNIKNFSVYKDRADQGLYSDNPIFVGGEFKGTDTFKEYPRYTKALNTSLCDNHSQVADNNDFENVIPTIKWVKLNTPLNAFVSVEYLSAQKKINFKNQAGTIVGIIDTTDFIKDGMVNTVAISGSNLVITFNTDAGKDNITIPLTDIFNPDNYYTKSQVNSAISTATNDMATKTWTNSQGFLKQHQSLENYYTKSQTYSKTEVDNLQYWKRNGTTLSPKNDGDNIDTTGVMYHSDIRLKENVKQISENDIKDIDKIKFYHYNFIQGDKKPKSGVIAQELIRAGFDKYVDSSNPEQLSVDIISILCDKIAYLENELKNLKNGNL